VAGGWVRASASHKQSRTRNKIGKKSADQGGRQARLLPTEAERGAGDVGVAPATVHID